MRATCGAPLAVLAAGLTAAILLAGCATPAPAAPVTTQASAPATSSTPPASSPRSALSSAAPSDDPWGSQDKTLAAARRIACGPKPHGSNPGLISELAHETGPPNPEPPAAPLTPVVTPSPPPVPGQLELEDLTLVPPPIATKPATCVDVALDALRTGGSAPVGAAQPAQAWLAILSAETPAIINPDGSQTPVFTSVLRGCSTSTTCHRCARPADLSAPEEVSNNATQRQWGHRARSSVSMPRPQSHSRTWSRAARCSHREDDFAGRPSAPAATAGSWSVRVVLATHRLHVGKTAGSRSAPVTQ
jgi:hypothetical protein